MSKFVNQSFSVSGRWPKLKTALRIPLQEALRRCRQLLCFAESKISSVFAEDGKGRKPQGEQFCEQLAARTHGLLLMVRTSVKKLAVAALERGSWGAMVSNFVNKLAVNRRTTPTCRQRGE